MVVIAQSAGTGPLLGTTNFNIGTGGGNGVVQFTDLQINSTGTDKELTAVSHFRHQHNLGESPDRMAISTPRIPARLADNWTTWTYGGGWANHENNAGIT